jgi:hypothetical protein
MRSLRAKSPPEHGGVRVKALAITLDPAPLSRVTGSNANNVVAGARFGNYLPPSPARPTPPARHGPLGPLPARNATPLAR